MAIVDLITFGASDFLPAATNGPAQVCLATYDRQRLAYDDTTDESAVSRERIMPATYTGLGTLKAAVRYEMATAASGGVKFDVQVEAVTAGDAVDLDASDSFDSSNTNYGTVPATAGYPQEIIITLTNKDSVAAGDDLRIKLFRRPSDTTNDTANGDARVKLVRIYEET